MEPKPKLVIVAGPTGAGKSELALGLARELGGQIVNADSLAFYRGLDIGTAKPSLEDRRLVPHHLIDILDPNEPFSAADFMRLARPLVYDLWHQKVPALAVGGTGLYLRSLTGGLFEGPGRDQAFRDELSKMAASGIDLHKILSQRDPESAAGIRPSDPTRIVRALEVLNLTGQGISAHQKRHALSDRPFEVLTLIVDRPSQEMDGRLKLRTKAMFEKGLLDELKGLLALGYPAEAKPFQSVGYRECLAVLDGTIDLERAIELTFLRTRQLAKRQRTWFRGQTPEATWLYPDLAAALKLAQGFLKGSP